MCLSPEIGVITKSVITRYFVIKIGVKGKQKRTNGKSGKPKERERKAIVLRPPRSLKFPAEVFEFEPELMFI